MKRVLISEDPMTVRLLQQKQDQIFTEGKEIITDEFTFRVVSSNAKKRTLSVEIVAVTLKEL